MASRIGQGHVITPEEFVRKLNTEWSRGTMIESHGTRAGAIIAFADETATAAAMWETNPSGQLRRGTLTAEAEIVHRGRTTLIVEVTVLDDERRLIARLVATQLAPAAPPATALPGRPGR